MERTDEESHHEHTKRTCPKADEIAECITFENAHEVVHALVNSDQVAAKAMKNELDYWNDKLGTL